MNYQLGSSKLEYFKPDPFLFIRNLKKKQAKFKTIDLSIGAPNRATPSWILNELKKSVENPSYHTYPPQDGSMELREAVAEWYRKRFNVNVDPETNVLVTVGVKEIVFNALQALINQGDIVLVPDPGYPTYFDACGFAGAKIITYDSKASCEKMIDEIAKKVEFYKIKILIVNFPSNPTGTVVDRNFYRKISKLSIKNSFVVISDNPYSEITFDGFIAPSYFEGNTGLSNSVEYFAFSKTYNMAGWRVGAAVGDERILTLLKLFKSKVDSNVFYPIQLAAAVALKDTPDNYYEDLKREYSLRRDTLLMYLQKAGLNFTVPHGAMYVWVQTPKNEDCWSFVERLYMNTGVLVVPGIAYGPSGIDYVRIGLVQEVDVLHEAGKRISEYLTSF